MAQTQLWGKSIDKERVLITFGQIEWYYIISMVLECHMLKYPPSKLLCRIPNFYLM